MNLWILRNNQLNIHYVIYKANYDYIVYTIPRFVGHPISFRTTNAEWCFTSELVGSYSIDLVNESILEFVKKEHPDIFV